MSALVDARGSSSSSSGSDDDRDSSQMSTSSASASASPSGRGKSRVRTRSRMLKAIRRRKTRAPRSVSDLEFGEVLGSGLFGKVFAARNKNNGDKLAVKEISGRTIKSKLEFLKEAQVLRTVRSEHLLRLVAVFVQEGVGERLADGGVDEEDDDDAEDDAGDDAGAEDGDGEHGRPRRRGRGSTLQFPALCKCYLVTEFCGGGSLLALLQDSAQALPWSSRIRWAYEAACGLEVLHRNNVIHRDLKAANALLRVNSERPDAQLSHLTVVLADFGLSRWYKTRTRDPNANADKLKALTVCGTPWSMAPELMQAKNSSGYSIASEVFSYGVMVVEILTRKDSKDVPRNADDLTVDMRAVERMSDDPTMDGGELDAGRRAGRGASASASARASARASASASVRASEVRSRRNSVIESCPPDLLALVAQCVLLDPGKRPKVPDIVSRLEEML